MKVEKKGVSETRNGIIHFFVGASPHPDHFFGINQSSQKGTLARRDRLLTIKCSCLSLSSDLEDSKNSSLTKYRQQVRVAWPNQIENLITNNK